VSVFSRKDDDQSGKAIVSEFRANVATSAPAPMAAPARSSSPDSVSKLGAGMLITGNIVCDGALQIHGYVVGDIHAAQLAICAGANVEGMSLPKKR